MKVAFHTLGCKVNLYESEALKETFESRGYTLVDSDAFADVYVINTCTVTTQSAAKSRKQIRRAIRRNPDAVVAVLGCYSQLASDQVAAIPGVDIVMGTLERSRLIEYVERQLAEREPILDVNDAFRTRQFDELGLTRFKDHTRAFLKIQDGCDRFCSFCIIPYARGPIRSRDPQAVLKEARTLIEEGYRELVLSGIHTGGYGKERRDISFEGLLRRISELDGLERVRVSSIEINQLTGGVLELFAADARFAPHLHIPLQHGADSVLRRMRRRYSVEEYESTIRDVRNSLGEDVAITTDVLAGYPGESEQEFAQMEETLERIAFSELHVFPFSPREGTKAASEGNFVDGRTKRARVDRLLSRNESLARRYRKHLLDTNRTLRVLIEQHEDGEAFGHSGEYVRVRVPGVYPPNTFVHVRLVDAEYPVARASAPLQTE